MACSTPHHHRDTSRHERHAGHDCPSGRDTRHSIADVASIKPIKNHFLLIYVIEEFRGMVNAEALLHEDDLSALNRYVAEALFTAAPTDAVECSVRRLLYEYDLKPDLMTLADLIATRGDPFLNSETRRLAASTRLPSASKRAAPASNSRGGASKPSDGGDYCFNWSAGSPCSVRYMDNGVCRYDAAGKHICGKDLGSGSFCQGKHRRSDHS